MHLVLYSLVRVLLKKTLMECAFRESLKNTSASIIYKKKLASDFI